MTRKYTYEHSTFVSSTVAQLELRSNEIYASFLAPINLFLSSETSWPVPLPNLILNLMIFDSLPNGKCNPPPNSKLTSKHRDWSGRNLGVKPTIGEEFKEYLTEYRSPDIRFPEEGNPHQEQLADQIDQRLWSYMYGPGMQQFLQRVDDRVASGIELLSAIEKGHEEKIEALQAQQKLDRSQAATQRTLWGLGGIFALGTSAFVAVALWPKVQEFFRKKTSKQRIDEAADGGENDSLSKDENKKNYFKWKRDRSDMVAFER